MFQIVLIASCSVAEHHREESGTVFFTAPITPPHL